MKNRAIHLISRIFAGSLLVSFFVFSGSVVQAASAPNVVSYQGRLLNSNSVPVSAATASMIFELYDASSGGTCLWSNSSSSCATATARTVTLTDGLFSENLGDTGASYAAILDSTFASNGTVYLKVTVEGEALTPRKQIASAPYSLNSDSLDGLDSDSDGSTAAAIPALNSSGALVITGNPSAATVGAGSLYVNPASGDMAADDTIFGIGDGGTDRFRVDKEGDVFIKTVELDGVGVSNVTSGASLIGVYDELDNSNSLNVQDVLDDFDVVITGLASGSSKWTDAGTFTFLTSDTDDLVVGGTTVGTASLFFDEGASMLYLGEDGVSSGSITFYTPFATDPAIDSDGSGHFSFSAVQHNFNDAVGNFLARIVDDGTTGHVVSSNGYLTAAASGLDTSAAGALTIGNTTATSVSVCNSAACDTLLLGSNADADTITIGDAASDTTSLNGLTVAIDSGDWDITTTGAITGVAFDANGTGNSLSNVDNADLTNDTIDFDKMVDAGALDAAWSVTGTAGETITFARTLTDATAENGATMNFTAADTTAATAAQFGLYLDNLASTEGLDASLVIDNSDADDAVGDGIRFVDGGGTFTDFIDTPSSVFKVDGSGNATLVDLIISGGNINPSAALTIGDNGDTLALDSSDWDIGATGDMTGIGALTMDGAFSQTGATTFSTGTGAVSLNGATTVATGNTFTANGVVALGDNGDTVAIDSSDWDIGTTGDMTGIGALTMDGNFSQTGVTTFGTGTGAVSLNGTTTIASGSNLSLVDGTITQTSTASGNINTLTANSLTAGTASKISSSSNVMTSGALLSLQKTASAGSAAFTGQIEDIRYISTFTSGVGLNSSGNMLNITRDITLNNVGNTHTISGAVAAFSNAGTQTAGTLTDTSKILTLTQSYASASGDVLTLSNAGTGNDISGTSNTWNISSAGLITTASDVALNGGDLTSTSATFNLLDAASNSTTMEIGGVTTDLGNTVSIATNSTTADTITIGNTNATSTLALNSGAWNMATTGVLTMTATSAQTTAIDITDTDYTNAFSIGDNNITGNTYSLIGTTATINFDNFDVASNGAVTVTGGQGIDTSGAGALALGNLNATSVTICNSANCDSLTLGTNTDADTIAIGDSSNLDTVSLNAVNWQMATTGNLNSAGDIDFNGSGSFGDSTGTDTFVFTGAETTGDQFRINATQVSTGNGLIVVRADQATVFDGVLANFQNNDDDAGDGEVVNIINKSSGDSAALRITQDFVDTADEDSQGHALLIEINEGGSSRSAIVVREDADAAGTSNNVFRVDTLGGVYGDGATYNTPADFAEFFATTDAALANSLLACRDPLTPNGVKRCEANNTEIVGVVSPTPGFVGNNLIGAGGDLRDDPNYRIVGLLGQVDTYVSADDGPIQIGDALSTSSTVPGYAGKVRGPANIIGFALEAMASGRGTIKVLVQPQWYGGDILGRDGSALAISGGVKLSALQNATAGTPAVDSNALTLTGSAWNGTSAEKVGLSLETKVNTASDYRLAIQNQAGAEVASFNQAGDLAISGKFYPSDRGVAQDSAYIYYDSSAGPGYMKTNAAGWSVGSYDFAEMFPSSDSLTAGEVVTFGADPQSVARSSSAPYDNKIAGVVSTRPGFLAGDYKQGSYPIALAGRVPTKATAENGAIHVGDPLTTSSRAGYAMKATKAGQILGYAMEPLNGDEGVITAFIRASYYAGDARSTPLATTAISGLGTASFASLDVTGTLNMSGGNILSVGSLEGMGGTWKITENGDFTTRGQIVKKISSYQGDLVDAFAVTSRQVTVQLSGTTTLSSGLAAVKFEEIDPRFNDIISTSTSYRVFLTPSGITGQLSAADRSNEGFTIRDANSANGVAVDWLVIAYEKDHEPVMVAPETTTVEQPVLDPDPVASDIVADNGVETSPEIIPGEVAGETDPLPVIEESVQPVVVDPVVDPIGDPIVDPSTETVVPPAPVDELLSPPPQSEIMPSTEVVNP